MRSPKRLSADRSPKPRSASGLGSLPEWNLADLYSGIDDPKVKRDLARADEYCKAFEEDFKGKLVALADGADAGKKLAQVVVRYEQLDDLLGRLCQRYARSCTRQVLWRRAGAGHRRL